MRNCFLFYILKFHFPQNIFFSMRRFKGFEMLIKGCTAKNFFIKIFSVRTKHRVLAFTKKILTFTKEQKQIQRLKYSLKDFKVFMLQVIRMKLLKREFFLLFTLENVISFYWLHSKFDSYISKSQEKNKEKYSFQKKEVFFSRKRDKTENNLIRLKHVSFKMISAE